MGRRQDKELRRLEEALMESDDTQKAPGFWNNLSEKDAYIVFNTDEADVDLDEYSEEVHSGKKNGALSAALTMLAMAALSAAILLLLKILGVL